MIEVKNLQKRYSGSTKTALNNVSFSVGEGEIVGLLGHNGAGKSTVLGIMLGMVRPDQGEVRIAGHSVQLERAKALVNIGAIFEAAVFYDYLTGWQNLRVLCSLSGWWDEKEAARVLELVNLTIAASTKTGTYSHGMRQRLALAQALLPRPRVLLLDEPTDGLDPEGIREFRETVLRLRKEMGMTILLNSHLLGEVEQMCDRCVILKEGRKVFEGPVGATADKRKRPRYKLETPDIREADAVAFKMKAAFSKKGTVELPDEVTGPDFVKALVEGGVRVESWGEEKQSLEDVYLELTGRKKG
ncbi:MAG: type transport system ATP-binding protein [Verrucomicrobiaceae bacterium]|nr:type transport system ATP-binding protein [Verrucomicrobiaceae bacterium]